MKRPEDGHGLNINLKSVVHKASGDRYHKLQLQVIKDGFNEIADKEKIIKGIEPHPESIDTDEKPN